MTDEELEKKLKELCLPSKHLIQRFISDGELYLYLCGIIFGVGITCLIHFFIIKEEK